MQLQACKNLASKGQDEINALTAEREVLFALITLIFLVLLVNPHFLSFFSPLFFLVPILQVSLIFSFVTVRGCAF
jgi:uncharacterized membrane protein (DUF485 family)